MNSKHKNFSIVFALILAALACTFPSGQDAPPEDSETPTEAPAGPEEQKDNNSSSQGMLNPGEVYFGLDGVSVGAVKGTIDQPVPIIIERIPLAVVDAVLPEIATFEGTIYRISPETPILPDTEHPLVIALPVPDGTPNKNLAMAVLLSSDEVDGQGNEGDEFSPETGETIVQEVWELVEGQVDQANAVFLAVLPYLPEDGRIVSLVSSDVYESPPSASNSAGPRQAIQPAVEVRFEARCRPAVSFIPFEACTKETRELFEAMAMKAFNLYVEQLGFKSPRLERIADISLDPLNVNISLTYIIEIREPVQIDDDLDPNRCQYNFDENGKRDGPLAGVYMRGLSRFAICLGDPRGIDFDQSLINHEFFHAVQHAYPFFFRNRTLSKGERSFVEGTATFSQDSTDTMVVRRTTRGVRDIDVGLFRGDRSEFRDNHAYNTQDFFLYLTDRYDFPTIEFLEPMLIAGGNREAVDSVFRQEYTDVGLPEIYWHWVKNQSFEKRYGIQTPVGALCQLSTKNGNYYVLSGPPPAIEYDPNSIPDPVPFELPPLTSAIYQINFTSLPAENYSALVSVQSSSTGIKSKFYDEADENTQNCWQDIEQKQLNMTVLQGQSDPQTIYVLIANTTLREDLDGTIEFSIAETTSAASCLVGDWQVDNASYLEFLRQTVADVEESGEFSSVDGIFGMKLDASGQVTNYSEDFSITMCSGENCLTVPVEQSGTATYSAEGDLLTITGGQSVLASISGVTGSAETEGGTARYQCASETLTLLMEGLPPLELNRVD